MSSNIEDGEQAFQKLKTWTHVNIANLNNGVSPDSDESASAFTALATLLDHVELYMSVHRRRQMALAVEKVLRP